MPSNKHLQHYDSTELPSPKVGEELDENEELFIAINQQVLAELLIFIDFADEKLTIGFVEINFASDRDKLIHILQNHPQCQGIQFAVLNCLEPELRYLRDTILQNLDKITLDPGKKLVVLITGLENSIGMYGEYPPVLQDLNFIRDAYASSIPHPLLLFLPDYALTRLAQYAPDFWAWRRGIFRFKTASDSLQQSLEIFQCIHSPDAEKVEEKLAEVRSRQFHQTTPEAQDL